MGKRNYSERIAIFIRDLPFILKIYIFIALLAPYVATDKPWIIQIGNETSFPAFNSAPYFSYTNAQGEHISQLTENTSWQELNYKFAVFPPFGFTPGRSDLINSNYVSPFQIQYVKKQDGSVSELSLFSRHLLGTGRNGEDVFSGLIAGTRSSLAIGLFSMLLAGIIGLILGGIAGYSGDEQFKMKRGHLLTIIALLIPSWFYAFTLQQEAISSAFHAGAINGMFRVLMSLLLFFLLLSLPILLKIKYSRSEYLNKNIHTPIDFVIMRITELFISLPRLILILTLAAISRPSVSSIILIIGLTSWTEIARLTRAEVMKLKSMDYITAAKAGGLNFRQILTRHLLPNCWPALSVIWIYGIASAIMVETGLSFLGIGVPPGTATWGSLMYSARENFTAWWMVLFPGIAIALLLLALNRMGRKLSQSHRKSSKILNIF